MQDLKKKLMMLLKDTTKVGIQRYDIYNHGENFETALNYCEMIFMGNSALLGN